MEPAQYAPDIAPLFEGLTERLSPAYPDANNNRNSSGSAARPDKYSLRPRSLRRGDPEVKEAPRRARACRPKQPAAPLSKYRRKTANARERSRMREINAAFEALRRVVPHLQCPGIAAATTNEKLTKITTLRLAMKYISTLSAVLRDGTATEHEARAAVGAELGDLLSDCSDLDCFLMESDADSLPLRSDGSEHAITPPEFAADLPAYALGVPDFEDSLSPTFSDQSLSPLEPFFSDFT